MELDITCGRPYRTRYYGFQVITGKNSPMSWDKNLLILLSFCFVKYKVEKSCYTVLNSYQILPIKTYPPIQQLFRQLYFFYFSLPPPSSLCKYSLIWKRLIHLEVKILCSQSKTFLFYKDFPSYFLARKKSLQNFSKKLYYACTKFHLPNFLQPSVYSHTKSL